MGNYRRERIMTYEQLKNIIEKNNIPENVHLMSNSGWECCATEMDGILWNPIYNEIHFTQDTEYYTDGLYHEPYKKYDKGSKNGEHRDGWIILN